MADIDQLRIEVEASAGQASSNLSRLADDVRSLKGAVRGAIGPVTSLANALAQLRDVGSMDAVAASMRSVAESAQSLSGLKISESIGNQLKNIADATATADPQALEAMATALASVRSVMGGRAEGAFVSSSIASQLRSISEASAQLSGVAPQMEAGAQAVSAVAAMVGELSGLPQISSNIGNQLRKIADGARSLSTVELPAEKVQELAESLRALASIPKNALSSTVTAMIKLPDAAKALHGLDFDQLAEDCRRLSDALADLPERLANVAAGMRQLAKANAAANKYGDLAKPLTQVLSLAKLRLVVGLLSRVGSSLYSLVQAAGDFVEDMNLFTVAMGDYGQQAWDFAQRVSALMGINPQEWAKGQGVFMSMAQGMGIASDSAALMSQQLTQLAYDLSSFYNISVAEAFEKVQAGLSGQLRPLRELGYDLSEARLQQDALAWGVTKSTDAMTQGEKAMLRYREMIEQVNFVHGDMARTIQSPMNQIRIFASTARQAAVAWGGVLLPALNAVLSVLIPLAKALANVGNMIASLTGGRQMMEGFLADLGVGGTPSTYGSTAAGAIDDVADSTGGAGKAADGARESYEELKRTILGFDELNVLKAEDEESRSPSGGSGVGGGAGGAGGGGMEGFELPTYDFLGDASGLYDRAVEEIMLFVERVRRQLEPLAMAFSEAWGKVRKTFDDVDLLGSVEQVVVSAVALMSNAVRNLVEVVTPLWVAFDVPQTVKDGLDLVSQAFLTLSDVVNGVGAGVRGFVETGLVPLAEWAGQLTRGELRFLREKLRDIGEWFDDHTGPLYDFGTQLGRVFTQVATPLSFLASLMLDFANSALATAIDAAGELADRLLSDLTPTLGFIADCIDRISTALKPAIDRFGEFMEEIERATGISFGEFAFELVDGIAAIVELATTAITGLAAVIADLATFLSDPFGFDFNSSMTKRWLDEFVMGNGDAATSTDGLTEAGRKAKAALDEEQRSLDSIAASGSTLGTSVVGGINSQQGSAGLAGAALVSRAVSGFEDGVKSSKTVKWGKQLGIDFSGGVSGTSASARKASQGVSKEAVSALAGNEAKAATHGKALTESFGSAIRTATANPTKAAKEAAHSTYLAMKPASASPYGSDLSNTLGLGIKAAQRIPTTIAKTMASSVLGMSNPGSASKHGSALAQTLGSGVSGASRYATKAASSMARDTLRSAEPGSAYNYGANLAIGFANGISGYAVYAYNAARNIANNVCNIISSALRIGSPSKVTEQFGKWTSEGLALGIEGASKLPVAAAGDMANRTADAVRGVMGSGLLEADMSGSLGIAQSVMLELDYERLTEAVAQGMLEGAVAYGSPSRDAVAQGQSREIVMMVDGQVLGRLAVDSISDMAARGYAPLDLMGV